LSPLDLHSANDQELELMVDRLREVSGYDVYFFNSTMEHGIPSVWGIAKNRSSDGGNLICAAGANPDPVKAIKSAMFELAGMIHHHDAKFAQNRSKYERMLHDPFAVETMEDHGMLYGLPEAEERLNFLLNEGRPLRTFAEEFKPQPKYSDLKDDLEVLLERFRRLNLDVIVVDQTSPITKRNGLVCVKALIPGMLPMTFGHHLIRVRGLERVLNVPMKLGFTKQPLTYEQLNPYPHPFP
jgi:ribosomal protein S12 methylthiotransferase accessory factor